MGRFATNTFVQIQYLKDRGMILDFGEDKIKEFLLDIGYYRLGFYWNPFEKDIEHNFKEGTKFSDVIKLYYLDVDLRHIAVTPIINFNNNNRHSLDSCIKIISYFLGQISKTRQDDLDSHIAQLFDMHKDNENLRNIIIEKINYLYPR